MRGPEILARTMSAATRRGASLREWQYHSRSDTHSKVACWALLFDLLCECDVMRRHADEGRLGFGINHVMVGPINKTLDLVLTRISGAGAHPPRNAFAQLVDDYGIALSDDDRAALDRLPFVERDTANDVHEVVMAVEAKACMTAHVKSMPRLHAEILATGYLARKASPRCITVSYSLVNAAASFVATSGATAANKHSQPADAQRVVDMLASAIPLARDVGSFGYDVVGVSVIDCRNDGSPVTALDAPPAPARSDHVHYERMIRAICSEYRARFSS